MASTIQRTFAAGEIAPALAARADLAKYTTGLRTCRNFFVQASGGVSNRAGTRFINGSRDNSTSTRLMRYVSEVVGESILIESGDFYLRFYRNGVLIALSGVAAYNGATAYVIGDVVVSGGVNYYCIASSTGNAPPNATFWYAMPGSVLELPTHFSGGLINWSQSGNTVTLTSGNGTVAPFELIYVSATRWIIRQVTTAPASHPPTAGGAVAGGAGTLNPQYQVTTAAQTTYEESIPSAIFQCLTSAAPTPAAPNVLTWTPPTVGAVGEYYVYKDPTGDGVFGFIGTATTAGFHDTGTTPDFTITPPQPRVLFNTSGEFPSTAGYYQQRRFFANTVNNPDAVYGSRVGFPSNFNISQPLQDDDAITFRIAGAQRNAVQHLLGLKTLLVFTDGGEWTIGQSKESLAPSNLPADQELYVGASDAVPIVIGNSVIYVQARGSIIRDVQFDLQVDGFNGRDLTVFSTQLFKGFTFEQIDYQQNPDSIVWCVRSDGMLLGLTYIREQDEFGWHRHDTNNGLFEDVCVVPELEGDVVYVLVRRQINGSSVRYIEKLESREIQNFNADSFFVDAGLTYSGAPATVISGLGHLEGQVVAVLADGAVIFNGDPTDPQAYRYTVAGGTIIATLATPASVIHAGLPITADLETLDLDVAGLQSQVRDKLKRVNLLTVVLDGSTRTWSAGPDTAHLFKVKLKTNESNQAALPFTGEESLNITAAYGDAGRVFIRHTDPLPVTVLGLLPNFELGG